jgi:hypothetical protein
MLATRAAAVSNRPSPPRNQLTVDLQRSSDWRYCPEKVFVAMLPETEREKRTGRPIRDGRELVSELSDEQLVEELMVAAMARDHRRIDRFKVLLAERDQRRLAA